MPLADGGDVSARRPASTRGPAAPGFSAGGPDVESQGEEVAEGHITSAAIDWSQVETYERGYLVSPYDKGLYNPANALRCALARRPRMLFHIKR